MSFPIIVILLILVIAGVFLYLKQQGSASPKPKARPAEPVKRLSPLEKRKQLNTVALNKIAQSNQHWGLCIEPENPASCCESVLDLSREQFTLDNVPNLPLTACEQPVCMCRYVGLKERRENHRRLSHDRREEVRFDPNSSERRSAKDRRKSGADIWFRHDTDA